jgi:hypothetical protein
MSNDDAESGAPQKVIKSPDWRLVYSNTFGLVFGDNDVRITIGVDQDPLKSGTDILEQMAVVMTPRTAKLLVHTLSAVIANYEAVNGPIGLPQDRLEKVDLDLKQQNEANQKKIEAAKAKK